ncbi:alpha-glucosidase [Sphingomonas jinjuensis]|uniref:Alpha-glucosidase n=1 Tax=Sphingomonas jinjuensis TaxID=535907 RepID=A0A840FB82_9SPHN|nr:alpha-amylase family glycosyl hydrolase [Sphingomonas jinjuensis]MBB4155280.1 alpha-glucosidase [Sphingomonas jinjuensis]
MADTPWWKGAVIYQIYPRSFADSNDDGIGDLPGITRHLDYVARLGVDAIWLSPFFKSPMRDFGYDVSDYRDVDPIFGTLADFDALIERAHALNLKVLIDQVYSHTSDQHPWFADSRSDPAGDHADWYIWADPKPDGSPPNNWQSVFGGPAWTWDGRRGQYYCHNFLAEQPQINGAHPAVQDELIDTARFWLNRGVDGFRIDAINFLMPDPALTDNPPAPADDGNPRTRPFDFQLHTYNQGHAAIPAFLERVRTLFDGYDGDRFTVAEVGGADSDREMKLFTQGGKRLNSAYGFDFLYASRLTAEVVADALGKWPGAEGEGWPSWAFENHDAPRALTRWGERSSFAAFARLKLRLLLSLRGNAILYYGEELGLPQVDVPFDKLQDPEAIANWPRTLSRDGARTPMPWIADDHHAGFSTVEPWLPIGHDHYALAVDRQEGDEGSLLHLTRHLIALRRHSPALRHGTLTLAEAKDALLVFDREADGQRLRCAFNLGAEPVAYDRGAPESWRMLDEENATADTLGGYGSWIAERI